MKVLIIEDEAIAAAKLKTMLTAAEPGIEIAGITGSVKETAEWLMQNKADLLFMDIQLSDGICFEIFEQIPVKTPIIFTTAYDQYTIRAFKVNSVSYLLKPVNMNDLQESLKKFKELRSAFTPDLEQILMHLQGKEHEYRKRFLIRYGDRIRKIEVEEVAYFYAMEKAVFLKTRQDQSFPVDYTLDNLETMVDPKQFFRVSRKYLIHMNAIAGMTAWSRSRVKLELMPPVKDEEVVVSIERSEGFKNWMNS